MDIISKYKQRRMAKQVNSYWGKLVAIIVIYLIIIANIILGLYLYKQSQTKLAKIAVTENRVALMEIATSKVLLGQLKQRVTHLKNNAELKVDNLTWRVRKIDENDKHKARITLVISNLGLSKEYTLKALSLTPLFTLGFSPYANDIEDWIQQSVNKGFETLMQLPMQQADYPTNDPGVLAMLTNSSIGENLSRLDSILHRSNKIIGLYSENGEVFSNSHDSFLPILEELHKEHLIYLNGNLDNAEWLNKAANNLDTELRTVDLIIGNDLRTEDLSYMLAQLLQIAKKKGRAVAIIRPYPFIIDQVDDWANNIDQTQYAIVPLSNQFLWEDSKNRTVVKLDELSEETTLSDKKSDNLANKTDDGIMPVEKAITAINNLVQHKEEEKQSQKNQPTLVHE